MEKNASAAVKPPARAIRKITLGRNTYSVPEIVVGVLLLVPSIVFLVFTFVIPVVQVVELSLTNFNMATGEMSFIGLRNYRYLLENSDFWLSMWNTCKYSAAKLIFDTSLALLIAVQLDKNIPLKKFLRSTYFAPEERLLFSAADEIAITGLDPSILAVCDGNPWPLAGGAVTLHYVPQDVLIAKRR